MTNQRRFKFFVALVDKIWPILLTTSFHDAVLIEAIKLLQLIALLDLDFTYREEQCTALYTLYPSF